MTLVSEKVFAEILEMVQVAPQSKISLLRFIFILAGDPFELKNDILEIFGEPSEITLISYLSPLTTLLIEFS